MICMQMLVTFVHHLLALELDRGGRVRSENEGWWNEMNSNLTRLLFVISRWWTLEREWRGKDDQQRDRSYWKNYFGVSRNRNTKRFGDKLIKDFSRKYHCHRNINKSQRHCGGVRVENSATFRRLLTDSSWTFKHFSNETRRMHASIGERDFV